MRMIALAILILIVFSSIAQADFTYLWCNNADDVYAAVDPAIAGVTLYHDAAVYNCCPEPAVFTITTEDRVLQVVEQVEEAMPCDCDCCFNLSVDVGNLAAGSWTVVYMWQDLESGGLVERQLSIVVPENVATTAATVEAKTMSDCLASSGVPDETEESATWGTLKQRYR